LMFAGFVERRGAMASPKSILCFLAGLAPDGFEIVLDVKHFL
jgi:hypothetical protein